MSAISSPRMRRARSSASRSAQRSLFTRAFDPPLKSGSCFALADRRERPPAAISEGQPNEAQRHHRPGRGFGTAASLMLASDWAMSMRPFTPRASRSIATARSRRIGSRRTSPPSTLALRRFSGASISMKKASSCPTALHRRGELEDTYERLLTELSWLLDPLEHNPWPHHATISGASLGITRTAYCRVGRLPRVALGRGQGADRLAFAPRCKNSLLPDRPRDHVRSNKWARAGRRRGHPCHPKQGARRVLRRRLGALSHGVCARRMARALATTAWRGTPCARSRLGGRT